MSIAAPATNPASDLELKLPATIGSAGEVLKNSSTPGTLEFGAAGGGKINQILMYTDSDNRDLSVNTSTWTQVPSMQLAITTTSNSSKVMIMHNGTHFQDTADITAGATIFRDTTNLGPDEQGFQLLYGSANDFAHQVSIHYLDTPGNAGTYTYKIYYKSDRNDGHYNQWGGRKTMSILTLWEVLP
jgi:hypothetical protein